MNARPSTRRFAWLLLALPPAALAASTPAWFGSWQTSPAGLPTVAKVGEFTLPPNLVFRGTLRYRLRLSAGGHALRLRFSNEYGDAPLHIAAASVGIAATGMDAAAGSLRRLSFGGQREITLPAGAPALSDSVELEPTPLQDLIVSVYVPDGVMVMECLPELMPQNQVGITAADKTFTEAAGAVSCVLSRPLVTEVDVRATNHHAVVVTLGDSITDGAIDPVSGDRGWPGALARRVAASRIAVVNAGIGGNRLLDGPPMFGAAALARFDRDVLSVPGITDLIVLEGINDIGQSGPGAMLGETPLMDPRALIAALSQLIDRAHERGLMVYGGTLLPFAGAQYYSVARDTVRAAVNAWIRGSGRFDAVIDFDAALRQTNDPLRLRSEFDSGDHLHPSAAGYRAMGALIDQRLFRRARPVGR